MKQETRNIVVINMENLLSVMPDYRNDEVYPHCEEVPRSILNSTFES